MVRVPVVDRLANELDVWEVLEDGSLYFELHRQGTDEVLHSQTVPPKAWHWEPVKVVTPLGESQQEARLLAEHMKK